jgi:hypothetical protein
MFHLLSVALEASTRVCSEGVFFCSQVVFTVYHTDRRHVQNDCWWVDLIILRSRTSFEPLLSTASSFSIESS